jgi:serine/threonine-protein kinase
MTGPSLRDQLQESLGTAYSIERELGGGGMSRVFLARDEALGRDIVIKVLPRELAAEMSAERFTREIKLAAALQHPHVLPVLSAGVSNGLPYYTMPFVRGESLRVAMDKKSLSPEEAMSVLSDVARALRYAHGEGVVHRDIKPENILLSSGSAVVVDFGIAKALSASRTEAPGGTLTLVGTSIGTPAYMSPEQAAADPNIDHRADIYAWGVMAYELLAGAHPFAGSTTPQQYLKAHLAETPSPLRKTAPTISGGVGDIVMRALEKDPDKRPQSADEVLRELGAATMSGHQAGQSRSGPRWRIPALAAVAVLLVVVGFTMFNRRNEASAASPIMLAVLPFENQGPEEQDYFVDGLTDAVNGKLAGLAGVSVIDRRSTQLYKKTTKPVKQIGSELGVQYVLGGVVRWAKSDSGWRAQVMPTLVNTSDATTKWAGEPVVVSSSDPFSAQTEIASKVAGALRLALGADDRKDLAARPTENMDAYDAFLRGRALFEQNVRISSSLRVIDQAVSEFKRAVALDPKFAQAWAYLAYSAMERAREMPGDTASERIALDAARRAEAMQVRDPIIIDVRSALAWFAGDKPRSMKIIADAIREGIVSPDLLITHAFDLADVGKMDSARATVQRAIRMNPRFTNTLLGASDFFEQQKDFSEAERTAKAAIAVDPTDERGWASLASIARKQGVPGGMKRAVEDAFKYIPSPSNLLLVFMVYAGDEMGSKFVKMTPEQIRIESLADSVATYYDNKADYFLGRGDAARARVYHDSIIAKLQGRKLSGPGETYVREYLAFAYASNGRMAEANAELDRAAAAARRQGETRLDGAPDLNSRIVAAIKGRAGDYDGAIRELRLLLKDDAWTRAGIAREPKMQALRGNPKFEAFLKEPE